jgi:hypothetical protein
MPFIAVPAFVVTIAVSVAVSVGLSLLSSVLFPRSRPQPQQPQQPDIPKPADGKYNLKQNVPSLTDVLGRVKKGADYVFLEERNGSAYHIMVSAGHRIHAFVQHYLHDEAISLNGENLIVAPTHFGGHVGFVFGLGLPVGTPIFIDVFPEIWTADHRGDGLAKVGMVVNTVPQETFQTVFPQGMPVHNAVLEGALVYDPREESHDPDDPETWAFSTNLALLRLAHLTRPSGGKLTLADMYLSDWIVAADVCDEVVTNRDDEEEPRYHGGLWYRHDADPVEIGRTLDEAAELVLYERADGLIGVHAGAFVAPDIRITELDILEFTYAANRSAAATVLAVRGRFTDPGQVYNTVDAAIWGDPYVGDDSTQRTKTIDNAAVQSHNHMQRLQKLAFIRANAARVSVTIPYLPDSLSRFVAYRRFVKVHYPSRGLDEAVLEVIGRPKLSLANLTISFEGVVVPATLYDFDATTEEGEPGGAGDTVEGEGVPVPEDVLINFGTETLAGGQTSVYAIGSWTHVSDALTYELEYQLADASEPARSVVTRSGESSARTAALRDGASYRFRVRTLSNGGASDWTSYITDTAEADAVAPGPPTGLAVNPSGLISGFGVSWVNPNSPNLHRTELYRADTTTFADAVLIYTNYGAPAQAVGYEDGGLGPSTKSYWVKSFNASGVASTLVGPETATLS